MSGNDSSTGGYLQPHSSPAPLEDQAIQDFFQAVLQQLSGLDGTLVRPRWQGEPPNMPERSVDWLSFGISRLPSDTYAVELHTPATVDDPQGKDTLQRHETIEILCSCYGPNAQATLSLVRDSLQIEQNRAVLTQNGMGLQESTEIINAPLLAKSKWLFRYDMTIIIRRAIERDFSVLNILTSDLFLKAALSSTVVNP